MHKGHLFFDFTWKIESDHRSFCQPALSEKATSQKNVPDVKNILSCWFPTVHHVLGNFRNKCVQALSSACHRWLKNPGTQYGYRLLFTLKVCCLRLSPHKDKVNGQYCTLVYVHPRQVVTSPHFDWKTQNKLQKIREFLNTNFPSCIENAPGTTNGR